MSNKRFQKTAFGLLAVVVVALGSYVGVQAAAYSGTVYGRTTWHGYFTNNRDTSGIEVLPAISGGQAIPNSVNTVTELINLLKSANASSNTQKKTGSAFIVYTMLGLNGGNHSRTVSAANWTEITDRLNDRQAKGKIAWSGNVSNSINSYYQGGGDDAWFDEYHNEAGIRILKDDGSIAYELLRRCANPMGRNGEVPEKDKDTEPKDPIDGDASSLGCQPMLVTVTPGRDANGNGIPTRVSTILRSYGPYTSPATINITNPHTTGDIYTVTYRETRSWISGYTQMSRLVKKTIDGKVVWVREYWTRTDYSPARSWTSSIGPCYAYKLTPTVAVTPSGVVEPGATYTVTPSVTNSGAGGYATKSKPTDWQVTKMVLSPGAAVPNSPLLSPSVPCSTVVFRRGGVVACTTITSGNRIFAKSSTTPLSSNVLTAEDFEVGTRVCYALSLKPNASSVPARTSDGWWAHSKPSPQTSCLIIGKRPKVQVHNGDLSVGKALGGSTPSSVSSVQTSTSVKNGNTFGSWIEYGIFATGSITGAASGSGYAGISGMASATVCKASKLSFALATGNPNCVNTSPIGAYKANRSIPDVAANFPIVGSTPVLGTNDLSNQSKRGLYTATGNLTLTGGTIEKGRWLVLNAPGRTVTIDGDIRYTSASLKSIDEIPQLVIIADRIIINDDVTNVDAWLIAKGGTGTITTCSSSPPLTSDICNQQLTVNGPVMAKKLYLLRTGGSGPADESGDPAEIFNLRSDAYLWASARAAGNGRVQTVYTTELPPRL